MRSGGLYQRPWHLDLRPAILAETRAVKIRFIWRASSIGDQLDQIHDRTLCWPRRARIGSIFSVLACADQVGPRRSIWDNPDVGLTISLRGDIGGKQSAWRSPFRISFGFWRYHGQSGVSSYLMGTPTPNCECLIKRADCQFRFAITIAA